MKKQLLMVVIAALIGLAGCGSGGTSNSDSDQNQTADKKNASQEMKDDQEAAKQFSEKQSLQEAKNPTFPVGSKAIVQTGHMKGMKGAKATITGAYDTTVYEVSYKPTTGGKEVHHHKWVVQSEIKDAGDKTLAPGTDIIIEADHMKGMKGAKGKVESSKKTTVYMIDYQPTTGGKVVKNHKWVVEDELSKP